MVGRNGAVGQRLSTGWVVLGSNPGGGEGFLHPSRPALGPIQPTVQWVLGLLPRVKQPGRGVDHPPPIQCRG